MTKNRFNSKKVDYFEHELSLIFDDRIREFVSLCLVACPDYVFEDCPSSSGGKYHPLDELGSDGTLIHTKKVFTLAFDMVKALSCENNRDIVLGACIIHDLVKQGFEKSGYTVSNHPDLAVTLIKDTQRATQILTDNQLELLCNCVGYHYGPWGSGKWLKPIMDYSKEELTVFLCDYVVSKRFIHTDYKRRI